MKNLKLRKILLTICCAMLLVTLSVGATFAYLTSKTGTVTNTFTVGKVEITLDETKVDEYGKAVTPAETTTGNEYKMIAGHTYTKDPTVHVAADSEKCWLFVKVVNPLGELETTDADETIAGQMAANWEVIDDANGVYAYKSIVSAGANITVFNTFTLSDKVTNTTADPGDIVITAYAVQADGFDTAAAAWEAAPTTW